MSGSRSPSDAARFSGSSVVVAALLLIVAGNPGELSAQQEHSTLQLQTGAGVEVPVGEYSRALNPGVLVSGRLIYWPFPHVGAVVGPDIGVLRSEGKNVVRSWRLLGGVQVSSEKLLYPVRVTARALGGFTTFQTAHVPLQQGEVPPRSIRFAKDGPTIGAEAELGYQISPTFGVSATGGFFSIHEEVYYGAGDIAYTAERRESVAARLTLSLGL